MPLYDYRCPACGQMYEVTRPARRAEDPLLCTLDQTECQRVTEDTVDNSEPPASDPVAWYRSGHTHDDWDGAHIDPEGIGRWDEVYAELRLQASPWMERLRAAGFRGGDVLSAALSPAVGLFTAYAAVVDDEGRAIPLGGDTFASEAYLRGYLPHVWETLGRVALDRIFGAPPELAGTGISDDVEPDARLTALFLLWQVPDRQDEEARPRNAPISLDLVSCFADPLGMRIADWDGRIVEVDGTQVRLLAPSERAEALLGASGDVASLLARPVVSTLDRLHAAMLLQAAGRIAEIAALVPSDAAQRVEFRRIATALVAIYPRDGEEYPLLRAVLSVVPE